MEKKQIYLISAVVTISLSLLYLYHEDKKKSDADDES